MGFHTIVVTNDTNASIIKEHLCQPSIWVPTATLYAKSGECIITGYHSGDDYWMVHHTTNKLLQYMCEMQGKTDINLVYPLQYLTKYDIIRELKARGLYDLCWYCEDNTDRLTPCGECTPVKIIKLHYGPWKT